MSVHILAEDLRVIERGWLSANHVVLFEGKHTATLIDSGYVEHALQTATLIRQSLQSRTLSRIINTHSHSDHLGGNAHLKRVFGAQIFIPSGIENIVQVWDEHSLLLKPTGQRSERFVHDGLIAEGATITIGKRQWQAIAVPGHDPHALAFYEPEGKILITGDALWQDGFGILFGEVNPFTENHTPALMAGFEGAKIALDRLASLAVDWVIPGHGAPFSDFHSALARAYQKWEGYRQDPVRLAQYAIKACFLFNLLERKSLPVTTLADYLQAIPFFAKIGKQFLHQEGETLARWLIASLEKSQSICVREQTIFPCLRA